MDLRFPTQSRYSTAAIRPHCKFPRRKELSMDGFPPREAPVVHSDPALPAVPLLDMQRQYEPLREAIRAAIDRVCESGRFVLGPDCEQLEKGIAAYTGAKHAVACASGSDALLLALMALGIQPRD